MASSTLHVTKGRHKKKIGKSEDINFLKLQCFSMQSYFLAVVKLTTFCWVKRDQKLIPFRQHSFNSRLCSITSITPKLMLCKKDTNKVYSLCNFLQRCNHFVFLPCIVRATRWRVCYWLEATVICEVKRGWYQWKWIWDPQDIHRRDLQNSTLECTTSKKW